MIDSNGDSTNGLTAADPYLSSLAAILQSQGALPTVSIGTLGGDIAQGKITNFSPPYNATLTIDSGQLNSSGQNPTQVVFHELDHIWYQVNSMNAMTANAPSTAVATIANVQYSFDLTPVKDSDGNLVQSPGAIAYEHVMIHNDLVSRYGFDDTSALLSALKGASNPPSDPAATATANLYASFSALSWSPAGPPSNANCTNTALASVSRRPASIMTHGPVILPGAY